MQDTRSSIERKGVRTLPILRTEFGLERTTCACETCVENCRHIPGYLIPADLGRLITEQRAEGNVLGWARENLLASPGFVVAKSGGAPFRIPTLVPARKPDRSCKFLDENDRCRIHTVSPFACSFFDVHMSHEEADARSSLGAQAVLADWAADGPYSRIWRYLDGLGLRNDPPELSRARLQYTLDRKNPPAAAA